MRHRFWTLCALSAAFALAACSDQAGDTALAAAEAQGSDALPVADPGKTAFLQCAACHAVAPDEGAKVGPSLAGVVGREAGRLDNYQFSNAMAESGLVWTREELDAFIAAPMVRVPGTRMVFAGIADAGRRQALIDYLERTDTGGQP